LKYKLVLLPTGPAYDANWRFRGQQPCTINLDYSVQNGYCRLSKIYKRMILRVAMKNIAVFKKLIDGGKFS